MTHQPTPNPHFLKALQTLNSSVTDFRTTLSHMPTINVTLPQARTTMTVERAMACELLDRWDHTHPHTNPTISDIARTLGLEQSTASRLITGLANDGLITRTPNPNDRRSVVLGLSDAGKTVLQEIRTYRDQVSCEIFCDWSVSELEEAAAMLDRISGCVRERSEVAVAAIAEELPPATSE